MLFRFVLPMYPGAGPQIGYVRHCLREITHHNGISVGSSDWHSKQNSASERESSSCSMS